MPGPFSIVVGSAVMAFGRRGQCPDRGAGQFGPPHQSDFLCATIGASAACDAHAKGFANDRPRHSQPSLARFCGYGGVLCGSRLRRGLARCGVDDPDAGRGDTGILSVSRPRSADQLIWLLPSPRRSRRFLCGSGGGRGARATQWPAASAVGDHGSVRASHRLSGRSGRDVAEANPELAFGLRLIQN